MAVIYAAVRKAIGTDYEIEFPDLPGCKLSVPFCGDIQRCARDAVERHFMELKSLGHDFVFISTLKELIELEEYRDVTWHCLHSIDSYGLCIKTELH